MLYLTEKGLKEAAEAYNELGQGIRDFLIRPFEVYHSRQQQRRAIESAYSDRTVSLALLPGNISPPSSAAS